MLLRDVRRGAAAAGRSAARVDLAVRAVHGRGRERGVHRRAERPGVGRAVRRPARRPGAGRARFPSNPERVAHDDELTGLIEAGLAGMTADAAAERLDALGIANARLRTAADLADHPQLAARDRWRTSPTPGGPVRALLPPVTVAGRDAVPRAGAGARRAHRRGPGIGPPAYGERRGGGPGRRAAQALLPLRAVGAGRDRRHARRRRGHARRRRQRVGQDHPAACRRRRLDAVGRPGGAAAWPGRVRARAVAGGAADDRPAVRPAPGSTPPPPRLGAARAAELFDRLGSTRPGRAGPAVPGQQPEGRADPGPARATRVLVLDEPYGGLDPGRGADADRAAAGGPRSRDRGGAERARPAVFPAADACSGWPKGGWPGPGGGGGGAPVLVSWPRRRR